MRPVKLDGKHIGYAEVVDGVVTQMNVDPECYLGLSSGEHEVTIELDSVVEKTEDGGVRLVFQHLSSKFTTPPSLAELRERDIEDHYDM